MVSGIVRRVYTAIWHGLYCGVLRITSFACYKVDLYMHDMLTIQYYLNLENYAESTEKAKNYMMEQAQSMTEYCKCDQQKDQQSQIDTEIYKNIIMTTTNSIEGYNIVKYIDLVCGEVVVPNGLLGIITSGTFLL